MAVSFWTLLQDFCDSDDRTEAWVLKKVDLNHGTFTAWRSRGVPVLPARDVLLTMASVLKVDYEELVASLLVAAEYLPEQAARAAVRADRRPTRILRSAARKDEE